MLVKLPEHFREHGYKNSSDMKSGPFQFAMDFDGTYFEWLQTKPEQQEAFNRIMALSRADRGEEWFDFSPQKSDLGPRLLGARYSSTSDAASATT